MAAATTDLTFHDDGPRSGPALLLVHPLGADAAFWDEATRALSSRYRTIHVDRRGSGSSPVPSRDWTLDDHADDLESLRAALGLDRVIPVGVAAGAMACVRYAVRYPAHVIGAVLCNPILEMTDAADVFLARRAKIARTQGMDVLAPEVVDAAFAGLGSDHPSRASYDERFRRNDPVGYERTHRGMRGASIRDDLARLDVPVAVVTGEHDAMVKVDAARTVAELITGATFRIIPDASHFPPIQNADGFLAAIAPLLEQVGSDDGESDART